VFELGETLEINPWFHNLNRNKLSITIDITKHQGAELIKKLVRESQLVVENFTPGVLERHGLDYQSLTEIKQDIVMISLSPTGQHGPLSQILAYAPIVSALSGIDSMVGYPSDQPLGFKHAYADPTASLFGAFAVLAALRYKEKTGKGQYIDLSQVESVTSLIGEAIMDFVMNRRTKGNQGNLSDSMAPHGNYPCQGDDKWVSLAVRTDDEWEAFCKAIGRPPWTKDTRFADKYKRLTNSEELDKHVAEWTSKHTDYEAAEILQRSGVAAAPVLSTDAIFLDPHFNERHTFADVDHPIVGGTVVYDLPWKLSGVKRKQMRHAPILGEHNDYVFGKILGLTQEERYKLVVEEVIY
jgi:benzylsuccinate CoA-transferase BbsF subunit